MFSFFFSPLIRTKKELEPKFDIIAGGLPCVRSSLACPLVTEQQNQWGQAVFLIPPVVLLQCC